MNWGNNRWIAIGAFALMVIFFGSCGESSSSDKDEAVSNELLGSSTTEENSKVLEQIILLKDSLNIAESPEKRANFATRLADNYVVISKSDSAAYYLGIAAENFPNEENLFEAGKQYFNAYSVEIEEDEVARLAQKSESFLLSLMEYRPEHVEGRVLLGVLYLTTNRVEEGVQLLRKVLESNPGHQEANYNLGVHALQAGAFEPASSYFETIVQQDSANVQSTFYLALCYQQIGRKDEAVRLLNRVKELDSSPEVQANVDAYLNDIE